MAKQRRSRVRPSPSRASSRPTPAPPGRLAAAPASPAPRLPTRPGYPEAVAAYEQGVQALQRRDFQRAAELFRAVIDRFPDERELHERVRTYLKICERQSESDRAAPRTMQERLYAATLAMNAQGYEEALDHLRSIDREEPTNDHAQYMLAVAHTLRGNPDLGLVHLRRAIELNPENRALARQDPDLEQYRLIDGFRSLLDAPFAAGRRRVRSRPAR